MDLIKKTENRITFIAIAKKYIKREGIDNLLKYIENTDFFEAPASSRYHLAVPGGLCQHSLNVYYRLIREYREEYGEIPDDKKETLTIVSLFHDLCKADFYKQDTRNVKVDGVWTKVPCYTFDEKFPIGHSEKSIILIMKHMSLTDEEIACINTHMGFTDSRVKGGDYSIVNIWQQYPLGMLLHVADMKAAQIDEVEK